MKLTSLPNWGLVLFTIFFTMSALAQDKAPKDELYLMHEDIIKIDMVDKYEANVKKELEMWKKYGMETTVKYASKSDDNHYYFLTPLENYGAIDKEDEYWANFTKKAGEETVKNLYKGYDGVYHSHRNVLINRSVELSYMPKNPRIKPEESTFTHFDHYYIKEGKMEVAKKMMREFKDLMTKKNSDDPFNVWIADIGGDIGWVVVTRNAKSNVDYYETANKRMESMAEELKEMWPKFAPLLKDFSHNNGKPMPDFIYSKDGM